MKCAAETLSAFKARPALLGKCIPFFYPIRGFSIAPHASSVDLIIRVSDTLKLVAEIFLIICTATGRFQAISCASSSAPE